MGLMWFRIMDIIMDRDLEAMGRLVGITTLLAIMTFLGWFIMAE